MDKYKLLGKIADVYAKSGNILEYLRAIEGRDDNTIEDIMIFRRAHTMLNIENHRMNLINLSWLWWK